MLSKGTLWQGVLHSVKPELIPILTLLAAVTIKEMCRKRMTILCNSDDQERV